MKRTIIAFTPLLLWAAAVLVVGALDLGIQSSLPSGSDKVAHFLMYGVGGALAAWAARYRGGTGGWIGLALVILTGAVDELHQSTVASRDADAWDWIADVAGATMAYVVARAFFGRK